VDVRRLVKPAVRALRAYEAREVPCRVKLDANESPYPFALKLPPIKSNRYPDPEARDLRRVLARQSGLRMGNVLVGNGSDELIYYLIATFGGPVLFPTPTFVMYGVIATALGERAAGVPLGPDFGLDLERTLKALRREKPKLVFLASPNNPTGNCLDTEAMLKVVEATKRGLVVLDEAYQPFASEKGILPLLADYPNLLVMSTLSKIGLAALRVGYLLGAEDTLAEVNKVRLPFNVNSYSQALAVAALRERKALRRHIRGIVAERGRLFKALDGMEGAAPYPSEANFILFRVEDAVRVHGALLKRGVLVRNMDAAARGCLRVTVGTPEENDAFLGALGKVLGRKKGAR
jgi:histidinol-phosphate aminotransferase